MDWDRIQKAGRRAFGEVVEYTPTGGNPEPVRGIFDAAHSVVELVNIASDGGPMQIESKRPILSVNLDSLDDIVPKRGDTIRARTILYKVAEIQVDGQGDADLLLEVVKE